MSSQALFLYSSCSNSVRTRAGIGAVGFDTVDGVKAVGSGTDGTGDVALIGAGAGTVTGAGDCVEGEAVSR